MLAPAHWHRDARECEPLRWLLRGCEPARSRWYAFRDRLAPELLQRLNAQLSGQARDLGIGGGGRGSLDGTTVAANASRHRLLGPATLAQRLGQLRQACAADAAGEPVMDRPAWMARRRRRAAQLARYE